MPLLATRGSASARALALDGFQRARVSFVYVSNALQAFTVPVGVTEVRFEVAGGAGAGVFGLGLDFYGGGPGGSVVTGILSTTPGATLYMAAARAGNGGAASAPGPPLLGQNLGGWPGGGNAGAPTWNYYPSQFVQGGAGGGYSGVFSANALNQGNALVVAGGGGGGGIDASFAPGGNGTATAGGARGDLGPGTLNNTATAGSALQGGLGDANSYVNPSFSYPAGGGGGGWYGGGGGYSEDGGLGRAGVGGRGSSFAAPSVSSPTVFEGVNSSDGYIILSW